MKPNRKLLKAIKKYLLRNAPDLVKPEWKEFQKKHPMWGMCYIASEVYYHMEGRSLGYRPMRCKLRNHLTHWWLEDAEGHEIDLVLKPRQRTKGQRVGFLTKEPSQRARKVINALLVQEVAKEFRCGTGRDF